MQFILAQILGLLALSITVITIQFRSKKKILLFMCLSNAIIIIQYALLDATTGAVIGVVNTMRCVVFFLCESKNKNPSFFLLLFFESLTITAGLLTWNNIWDLLPIISTLIFTYGLWQNNIRILKISSAIMCIGWITYEIIIKAYVSAIKSFCEFIASIIAIYKLKQTDKTPSSEINLKSD